MKIEESAEGIPDSNHGQEILSNRLTMALGRLEDTEKKRGSIANVIEKKHQLFSI